MHVISRPTALAFGLFSIIACIACSESSTSTAVSTVTGVTASIGNLQVGTVGTTLTDSLAVLVTNANGEGVADAAVHWIPNATGGSPSASSVTTDASGVAKIAWTLGTHSGTDSMTATVNGISYVFTATAKVGAASNINIVNYTSVTVAAGSTLPTLTVQVIDQYGNAVPNVPVTWVVTAGGGSLTSTTGTTNSTGLAMTTWTLGAVGGGTVNTVTATAQSSSTPIPPVTFTAMAGYAPPQLIAQAPIVFEDSHFGWPMLNATIQSSIRMFVLDLGATYNGISTDWLANAGVTGNSADVQFGTVTQNITFYTQPDNAFVYTSSGVLGTPFLSQFDLVVDGPNQMVNLYSQPTQSVSQPTWFPSGLTAADCMPMQLDAQRRVFFPTQVNGISLHSMFDSGSRSTNMNLAAATALGLDTLTSPNVHPAPYNSYVGQNIPKYQGRWIVTGVTITVGTRRLAADTILIFPDLPRETSAADAELSLGTGAFSDRLLMISYSSKNVCVGQPEQS